MGQIECARFLFSRPFQACVVTRLLGTCGVIVLHVYSSLEAFVPVNVRIKLISYKVACNLFLGIGHEIVNASCIHTENFWFKRVVAVNLFTPPNVV